VTAPDGPGGRPGDPVPDFRQRLEEAERRCERLEARVVALERERGDLRERLQALLGLLDDLGGP